MGVTVTETRIHVPRRRDDLLSRTRFKPVLHDLLDFPFTLISAPAGYGKTSLMVDLAHQAPYPSCWFTIDKIDQDPIRFFTHLIHAIRRKFPNCGEGFLSLLESAADSSPQVDQLAATLANDLYSAIQEHFVVFLDDYHVLENQAIINAFISQFGQVMDDNVHLVIASRAQFSFPDLPLLTARDMVKGIDQQDLAFRADEIKAYLERKLDQPITPEESRRLEESTEGWVTGLLLFACQGCGQLRSQYKAVKVTGANIQDYFLDQVLAQQTPQVQGLMMKAALLDEFNSEVCRRTFGATEDPSWDEFISILLENNLFVEVLDSDVTWLRFHQLFRDFLAAQLKTGDPAARQRHLTAVLQQQKGQEEWEKAFQTAQDLNDPQAMAEVIYLASSPLFHAGRLQLLSEWLSILPEKILFDHPLLSIFQGVLISTLGNPKSGLERINSVIEDKSLELDPFVYERGLLCRATTFRLLGKYQDAFSDISHILSEQEICDVNQRYMAEAYREAGIILNHLGRYEQSIESFNSSLRLYSDISDTKNIALVHLDVGLVLMNHGNLHQAKIHFSKALLIWQEQHNLDKLSVLCNNFGILNTYLGNYLDGKAQLDEATKYAQLTSNLRMKAFIQGSLGDLASTISNYSISNAFYSESIAIAEQIQESYLLNYLYVSKSSCLRHVNALPDAKYYLDQSNKITPANPVTPELGLWHLESGFLLTARGQFQKAQSHLAEAEGIFLAANCPFELARARLGLFLAALESGQSSSVQAAYLAFWEVLEQAESIHPLLPEICHHREQLAAAGRRWPDLTGIAELLSAADRHIAALPRLQREIFPRRAVSQEPDRLEIQALGGTQVLLGGRRLRASEWIHQKTAREILFFLLSQERGITKEQLGLVFWPESSPDLLSCQFKNAIYRLRRSLGRDSILYDPETRTYAFNRRINYTYDVEEFESLVDRAAREPRPPRRIELQRQAAAVYKHPFAPRLEGVWTESIRRRLHRHYENILISLAEFELQRENFQASCKYCQMILELDSCQELAYQLCMKAYSGLNDRTSVRRLFLECKSNLYNELNSSPSYDTLTLYKDLS